MSPERWVGLALLALGLLGLACSRWANRTEEGECCCGACAVDYGDDERIPYQPLHDIEVADLQAWYHMPYDGAA